MEKIVGTLDKIMTRLDDVERKVATGDSAGGVRQALSQLPPVERDDNKKKRAKKKKNKADKASGDLPEGLRASLAQSLSASTPASSSRRGDASTDRGFPLR